MTALRKPKLLVIAPGVTKDDVGEVLLAYRWLEGFAQHYDVTLLTMAIRGRNTISDGELPIKIVCLQDYGSIPGQERINSMLKPWYPVFYAQARKWLKCHGSEFDWIHQLNPFAMRYPCPASKLGLNYSLGPLAGGVDTPPSFEAEMGAVPWFVKLRGLDGFRARYDPWLRASFDNASLLFVAASYVKDIIRSRYSELRAPLVVESELGVSSVDRSTRQFMPQNKLRLLYVGRIVRTKGLRDALRAVAMLPGLDLEFNVIGAGEDLAECVRETDELGIAGRVRFHGRLPRTDIQDFYLNSDLMVFPSFREPTGGVVVEAMQVGLPQIVADRGGPADMVDDTIGKIVAVKTPEQFAADIAAAIHELAEPEVLAKLSEEALLRCEETYSWDAKFERITAAIDRAITVASESRHFDPRAAL